MGYVQLFRTGALEAVDCVMLHSVNAQQLPASYEVRVRDGVLRYMSHLQKAGITGEVALSMSFTDVKGYTLMQRDGMRTKNRTIDRQQLDFPEVMLEIGASEQAVNRALKVVFDLAWNTVGVAESPNFDKKTGTWIQDLA